MKIIHTRRASMKEEKEDPFAPMGKFCETTASQEDKLLNCPFAGEPDDLSVPNLDQGLSSPESTPSKSTPIIILSPPDSQREEDDVVYLTPPEEQNLDESSSDGARTVNVADGFDGKKRPRFFEGQLDDECISKKNRVSEELNGETETIGETEPTRIGIDGNVDLETNTEVIDLTSSESVKEEEIDDGGVVSGDQKEEEGMIGENEGERETSICELDAGVEQDRLMKESDDMRNVKVNTGERPCKKVSVCGSLDSGKVTDCGCVEMREESGVGGDDEFANFTEDENTSKYKCEDGLRRGRKNIEDIDKFRYVDGGEVGSGKKKRYGAIGGAGSRRELPLSLKGKDRNMGETTRFFNDCVKVHNFFGGDVDNSCEDMDFLEIAKSKGLTFPRPRWWLPEDDDEK